MIKPCADDVTDFRLHVPFNEQIIKSPDQHIYYPQTPKKCAKTGLKNPFSEAEKRPLFGIFATYYFLWKILNNYTNKIPITGAK